MNNGNPSRVGRRRRRTGSQEGGPSGHRTGARGSGYSGKRRAASALPFAIPLPDKVKDKLRDVEFNRLHLAVAGAVTLVIVIGVSIVLDNLPDDATGGEADAAFLYTGGQALPADFADRHPALSEQINAELEARYGLTPDRLYDAEARPDGLRVVLTLDKALQEAAETTSGEAGVVAIEPGTGAVLCYYGAEVETGADQIGPGTPHPPSSVFDMITAATALEAGASIESWWSDRDADVTLAQAVQEDHAVAMDAVAEQYGVEAVLGTANGMGLNAVADSDGAPRDLGAGEYDGLKAADLPTYPVSVVDMASVYATIAADGVHAQTHLIGRVIDADGQAVEPDQQISTNQALAETTAQDLQYLGLGESEALEDRDYFGVAADFHGTTTQSWFVGAIPQLSVAAWANGSAAADGGLPLWRNVVDTAIEVNDYEAANLPGASGAGDDLTEGIADDDGKIDADSEYCKANPDDAACGAASETPSESDSPSEGETSEEPEPDPEPDPDPTSADPEPDPPTSDPEEPSPSEGCDFPPFC
ncbi:MAG TPA: penicillin-binding transpeptidase domain-containing protein [Glycomyces sp.]|nr:penicillin-binding transpeptidase domain-containing protein [Glycomyces sp.]